MEIQFVYTIQTGDARTLDECDPSTEVVSSRIVQLTQSTATIGFTALPGAQPQSFTFSCDCLDVDCTGGAGGGGGVGDATPEIGSVSPLPLQAGSLSTSIIVNGSSFGPQSSALEVGGSGGCQLLNLLTWSDSTITALISVPSASSWTTCTFAVESLGASGTGFQPSDSSSPESAPYFDQADPDLPTGPDIELTVTRPSLTTLAATGTPSGGTYAVNVTGSGSGAAATISSWSSTSQNATITLGDPPNPDPTGAPSPGALASVSIAYQTTDAVDLQIPVPTFGMSCYIIASENDYWNGQSCTSTTIAGTTYSGTTTNPPNLTGTFCNAFLQQVRLQGSGQSLGGLLIQYNTRNSTWQVVNQIVGADGTPLVAGQTVARDRTIIPRGGVLVSLDGIGSGLLANDAGGKIKGYRLDLFNGFGQKACANFANPIVVGACSPGNPSCPGLTTQ